MMGSYLGVLKENGHETKSLGRLPRLEGSPLRDLAGNLQQLCFSGARPVSLTVGILLSYFSLLIDFNLLLQNLPQARHRASGPHFFYGYIFNVLE